MAPYAASIEDSRRKLQYDLYYIKHMSFFLDVYIFMKTIKTVIFGRERRRATKPGKEERLPRYEEIKTETLFLDAPHSAYTDVPPQEDDERRRTQRLA